MNNLRQLAIAVALGMQDAKNEMLTSYSTSHQKQIVKQQQSNVLEDMMEGKLTKQVQEFRYRHYAILRESSRQTRAKERRELWNLTTDPHDSYPPELGVVIKNSIAGLHETNIEKKYTNVLFENKSGNVPIEKYTNKLVVRNINCQHKLVEIYFNKHQVENGASPYVLSELSKLINNPQLTPLTNINKICFVTQNAYGVDDFLLYEYQILSLYKVVEWNGNIIVKFVAEVIANGEDVLKTKYYDIEEDTKIMSERAHKQMSMNHQQPKQNKPSYEELLLENNRLKGELLESYR